MKIAWKCAAMAATLLITSSGIAHGQGYSPLAMGTVSEVDAGAKLIRIADQFGGLRTIYVSARTLIQTDKRVSVSDLKRGDRVMVAGAPSGISAATIVTGVPTPPPLVKQPGMQASTVYTGAGSPQRALTPSGYVSAVGKIVRLKPLTIKLDSGAIVAVKIKPSAEVHEIVTVSLGSIHTGDRLLVAGQPGGGGSLQATRIAVNMGVPVWAPPTPPDQGAPPEQDFNYGPSQPVQGGDMQSQGNQDYAGAPNGGQSSNDTPPNDGMTGPPPDGGAQPPPDLGAPADGAPPPPDGGGPADGPPPPSGDGQLPPPLSEI